MDIRLGWKKKPYDARDFRLSNYITASNQRKADAVSSVDWAVDHILDQGNTGHCVGFGWAGFGISLPIFDNWGDAIGDAIYYQAKIEDGEPGQEDGSDTRSGAKAFMHFGALKDNIYAFANSMDEIVTWLKSTGPVVVGTNWYSSMFTPNSNGLVKVSGSLEGGHEYVIIGCDDNKQLFHCLNSWGNGWGNGGTFYISYADMEKLQGEQGDACTTCEISENPPEPTPTPVPTPTPTQNIFQKIWAWLVNLFHAIFG